MPESPSSPGPYSYVPGGGWFAHIKVSGDDGEVIATVPVVAWQIDGTGVGAPMLTSGDGILMSASEGELVQVWHPDERWPGAGRVTIKDIPGGPLAETGIPEEDQ